MFEIEIIDSNFTFKKHVLEEFVSSKFFYNELSVIFLTFLYIVVLLIGLLGNILLLLWIRKERDIHRRWKIFDKLVINLCCSDLMVLLSCCPFSIYSKITSFWHFGSFLCTFIHYIQGVSVTSNILSMTCLSLSRFLFVRKYYSYQNKKLYRLNTLMLLSIWLLSFAINVPLIRVRQMEELRIYDVTFKFCLEKWSNETYRKSYSFLVFTLIYFTPCSTLIFCHFSVTIALSECRENRIRNYFNRNESRKQAFRIKEDGASEAAVKLSGAEEKIDKKVVKTQKRLARFLIGTTLCFVFCWLPYNLVSFYVDLTESEVALILLPFTLLLGHAYSAFDPFVYLYLVKSTKRKKEVIYMRSLLFHASKKSWNKRSNSLSVVKEKSRKDFDCRTSTIIVEHKTGYL